LIKSEVRLNWSGSEWTKAFKEEMLDAYMKSAERIRDDAKTRVKRSSRPITSKHPGHLQDTIRAGRSPRFNAAFVFAGDRRLGVYWQHMVEFGTYFKPAHPFLRPAMDGNFNSTLADADREGKRILNKERRMRRVR
jgi:hypothetical protein